MKNGILLHSTLFLLLFSNLAFAGVGLERPLYHQTERTHVQLAEPVQVEDEALTTAVPLAEPIPAPEMNVPASKAPVADLLGKKRRVPKSKLKPAKVKKGFKLFKNLKELLKSRTRTRGKSSARDNVFGIISFSSALALMLVVGLAFMGAVAVLYVGLPLLLGAVVCGIIGIIRDDRKVFGILGLVFTGLIPVIILLGLLIWAIVELNRL